MPAIDRRSWTLLRGRFSARATTNRQRPVEAAGAVDAKNAPTAPWKTAQNAVSHSYHRLSLLSLVTGKVLPMFPVNSVTYVPGCTPFLLNTWLGHCAGAPRERAQRFVHGSRVRKEFCDVRVEQDDVGPLCVASCRDPSHGLREIVLRPHRVLVFATFPTSFVLHIDVSPAEWRGEH